MKDSFLRLKFVLATVLLASVGFAGCYDPTIKSGGLWCAKSGKKCPDGFTCSSVDQKCYTTGSAVDARPDTTVCSTPVAPLCADMPKMGQKCNPTCQTGECGCGRCNLVGKDPACTTAGAKLIGQVCNLGADDCSAGLICLLENCGTNLGRCYRYCARNDQCAGGGSCQIPILAPDRSNTGFLACDVAAQECDPVAKTGCPAPALNCYLTSANQTVCDCSNRPVGTALGEACTFYNDCAAGLVCVDNLGGIAGKRCAQLCVQNASPSGCLPGMRCNPAGSKYGYCGL